MKLSRNFYLEELVHPDFLTIPGLSPVWLLDPRIIRLAQFVRDRFNKPVTINDWESGGAYRNSGLRPFNSAEGAAWSDHKFGRAIDVKVRDIEAREIQTDVIRNYPAYQAMGLTAMEHGTPTWTHLCCRNTRQNSLMLIQINK